MVLALSGGGAEMATTATTLGLEWNSWLKDVPLIGPVADAVVTYLLGTKLIISHPIRWIEIIDLPSSANLNKAFKYLVSGLVLAYVITIPAIIVWGTDSPQVLYVVHSALLMLTAFVILHYTMALFGSPARLKSTVSMWCFNNGLFAPLTNLFYLPLMLAAGPWVMGFGFNADALRDPVKLRLFLQATDTPLVQIFQIALFVVYAFLLYFQLRWIKAIFQLGWPRTIVGSFLGLFVAIGLIFLTSAPIFRALDAVLSPFLRFV
jgi:hypothetical protein